MTRAEALKKGREIRTMNILKKIYQENKYDINRDHAVSFNQFVNTVKGNKDFDHRYKNLSMVAAARKYLRTRKFMSAEEIGIENMVSRLKELKTGREIKWGKPKLVGWGKQGAIYEESTREETMYDVLRQTVGYFNKMNMYWSELDKTYHIIGSDKLEYALMVIPPSPFTYEWVQVGSQRYEDLNRQYQDYLKSKGRL